MSKKDALQIAREVGITLKNLKTFEGHDGMLGINADICLNGFPFAHAYDDAWGGEMDIKPLGGLDKVGDSYKPSPLLERTRKMLKDVETEIAKYPEHEVEMGGGRKFMTKETLDGLVNALVDEHFEKKEVKKSEKKGIIIRTITGYSIISWKAGTIDNMLKNYPTQKQQVVDMIQKAYDECKSKGENVVNTEYLKSVGVKI